MTDLPLQPTGNPSQSLRVQCARTTSGSRLTFESRREFPAVDRVAKRRRCRHNEIMRRTGTSKTCVFAIIQAIRREHQALDSIHYFSQSHFI